MTLARPDAPADIRELTWGAHFMIWAFRTVALGRGDSVVLQKAFEDACSPVGQESLNAFVVFVRELSRQGRRRIKLAPPGCTSLTRDEQSILALFAAAQEGAHDRLRAHLAWLAAGVPAAPLPAAAAMVAQALEFNGHIIPAPQMIVPAGEGGYDEAAPLRTRPETALSAVGQQR